MQPDESTSTRSHRYRPFLGLSSCSASLSPRPRCLRPDGRGPDGRFLISLAADSAAGYARDASSQPFTMSRRRLVGPPHCSPRPRLFKECSARRGRLVAAPHSCRLSDDNAFVDWRTLGQTCSRGDPGSAICVQRLDDSLNSAIHTTYRSLLRSSSMHEPRDPPSEVVKFFCQHKNQYTTKFHKRSRKKPKTGDRFKAQRAAAQPILTDSSAAPNRMPAAHLYRTEQTLPSPTASARCFAIARSDGQNLLMILPQVHLRKPCYDF